MGNLLTDANIRLHDPSEVVSEPEPNGVPSYASRSATKKYRTTPLRGLLRHPPYFHNGIAATLDAVVELYDVEEGPRAHRGAEGRSGGVPEVALTRAPSAALALEASTRCAEASDPSSRFKWRTMLAFRRRFCAHTAISRRFNAAAGGSFSR